MGYIGFGFRWVWVPLGFEQSCSSFSFDMGTETLSSSPMSTPSAPSSILITEQSPRALRRFTLFHDAGMPAYKKAGQGGVALKVVALHRGSPVRGGQRESFEYRKDSLQDRPRTGQPLENHPLGRAPLLCKVILYSVQHSCLLRVRPASCELSSRPFRLHL